MTTPPLSTRNPRQTKKTRWRSALSFPLFQSRLGWVVSTSSNSVGSVWLHQLQAMLSGLALRCICPSLSVGDRERIQQTTAQLLPRLPPTQCVERAGVNLGEGALHRPSVWSREWDSRSFCVQRPPAGPRNLCLSCLLYSDMRARLFVTGRSLLPGDWTTFARHFQRIELSPVIYLAEGWLAEGQGS